MKNDVSATSQTSVSKKQTTTGQQLSFNLDQAPPGPYRLAKAVTLPGERQTYGVVQGRYPCEFKNPYAEHGLTKKQALKRLQELMTQSEIINHKSAIPIPLQPLPPMQRLGWLPSAGQLACAISIDYGNSLAGRRTTVFVKGQSYEFTTEKVKVFLKERRARRDGVSEPVTYSGYELLIQIRDNHGNWHRCLPNPQGQHPLIHDMEFLVEHFHIPQVPDLAALHPKKFAAYKRRLKRLEQLAMKTITVLLLALSLSGCCVDYLSDPKGDDWWGTTSSAPSGSLVPPQRRDGR